MYASGDIHYGLAELSLKGSRARQVASAVPLRFAQRRVANPSLVGFIPMAISTTEAHKRKQTCQLLTEPAAP